MSDNSSPEALIPRNTARGIVVHNNQILLMERWRPGLHYFSIPGGGIEPGETPEDTVEREIFEETSIIVQVKRLVLVMKDKDIEHQIYICDYLSGEPVLAEDAPEMLHMSEGNKFKPGWQAISSMPNLPFTYWNPLKQPIIDGLASGFAEQPLVIIKNT